MAGEAMPPDVGLVLFYLTLQCDVASFGSLRHSLTGLTISSKLLEYGLKAQE